MSPIPRGEHGGSYTVLNYEIEVYHYGTNDKNKAVVKAHLEKEIRKISISAGAGAIEVQSLTET